MNKEYEENIGLVSLSRYDIETKNFKKVLDKLNSNELNHHFKMNIVVDGYNNDKRELFEIKEVKHFFKKLIKKTDKWLTPYISSDTICLIVMCVLHQGSLANNSLKDTSDKFYLKISEKSWLKLMNKWISSSDWGHDFASHLAFEAFPSICPLKRFTTDDKNLKLLSEMIERGYDTSKKLLSHKYCAVKVLEFNDLDIKIRAYVFKDRKFTNFDFVINKPVLEILQSVEEFKSLYDLELNKVISYLEK